jgi:hypothetical protein
MVSYRVSDSKSCGDFTYTFPIASPGKNLQTVVYADDNTLSGNITYNLLAVATGGSCTIDNVTYEIRIIN